MTESELRAYRYSPDPESRAKAYQEFFRVHAETARSRSDVPTRPVTGTTKNLSLRKFDNPISVRNLTNNVPDEAVDVLLDVTRRKCKDIPKVFQTKSKTPPV